MSKFLLLVIGLILSVVAVFMGFLGLVASTGHGATGETMFWVLAIAALVMAIVVFVNVFKGKK